jgi:hypothetical protein
MSRSETACRVLASSSAIRGTLSDAAVSTVSIRRHTSTEAIRTGTTSTTSTAPKRYQWNSLGSRLPLMHGRMNDLCRVNVTFAVKWRRFDLGRTSSRTLVLWCIRKKRKFPRPVNLLSTGASHAYRQNACARQFVHGAVRRLLAVSHSPAEWTGIL